MFNFIFSSCPTTCGPLIKDVNATIIPRDLKAKCHLQDASTFITSLLPSNSLKSKIKVSIFLHKFGNLSGSVLRLTKYK